MIFFFKRFFKLLIIFFILFFINMTALYSDVVKLDKDEKIKDKEDKKDKKDKKIKDEKIKVKDIIIIANTSKNTKYINEKSAQPETAANVEQNILNLEYIQLTLDKIKKEIKQNGDKTNDIKISLLIIKNNVSATIDGKSQIITKLDKNQIKMIKDQNYSIETSISNLDKIFNSLETDKEIKNQELFNITLEIEKEINIIYRQFRAIDWILSAH